MPACRRKAIYGPTAASHGEGHTLVAFISTPWGAQGCQEILPALYSPDCVHAGFLVGELRIWRGE